MIKHHLESILQLLAEADQELITSTQANTFPHSNLIKVVAKLQVSEKWASREGAATGKTNLECVVDYCSKWAAGVDEPQAQPCLTWKHTEGGWTEQQKRNLTTCLSEKAKQKHINLIQ